jgi:hypothetical protein
LFLLSWYVLACGLAARDMQQPVVLMHQVELLFDLMG